MLAAVEGEDRALPEQSAQIRPNVVSTSGLVVKICLVSAGSETTTVSPNTGIGRAKTRP